MPLPRSAPAGVSSSTHLTIPDSTSFDPALSPSPSPSTPSGRPPKWTVLSMWTLIMAYMNTHLSLFAVLKVVEAFARDPSDVPKEESAHKKISSTAGKELRWARANDVADALSRLKSLVLSPLFLSRVREAGHSLPLKVKNKDKKSHTTSAQEVNDDDDDDNEGKRTAGNIQGGASKDCKPLLNAQFECEFGLSQRSNTELSIMTTESVENGISQISESLPDQVHKDPLGRVFMKYLYILITHITFTLSSNVHHRPKLESPLEADSQYRDSWAHDPDSPEDLDAPPPVPWDLLRPMDLNSPELSASKLQCQGSKTPDHKRNQCPCHLLPALQTSVWVQAIDSAQGLTPFASLVQSGDVGRFSALIDCFGNTGLHMLALGDAQHHMLLQAVISHQELVSHMNSMGQSFLHLLSPTWLNDAGALEILLEQLAGDTRLFYACDHYGRTFIHVLAEYARQNAEMGRTLSRIMLRFNVELSPDAFGLHPKTGNKRTSLMPQVMDMFPKLDMAFNSESKPVASFSINGIDRGVNGDGTDIDSSLKTLSDEDFFAHAHRRSEDYVATHTRLLSVVSKAFVDPKAQDERGRNALHCLGAAITSVQTMRSEQAEIAAGSMPRKRKHSRSNVSINTAPIAAGSPPQPAVWISPNSAAAAPPIVKPKSPVEEELELEDTSKERMKQRIETTRNLLSLGVDVNAYDHRGNTPLMAFVANSLESSADRSSPRTLIKLLVDGGAAIHARNRKGETALHVAVRRGNKLAMRALVEAGANVHVRDGFGRSVLDVLDEKFYSAQREGRQVHVREIARFHVCRAILAGSAMGAKQNPTALEEWSSSTLGSAREAKSRRKLAGALKKSPKVVLEDHSEDIGGDEDHVRQKRRIN
ncbi:ankyrin-like protein [Ceratocystis platani]|uniref:Ankyrin-like protein n=1 Tax=Ceratocystis fimbriata f. sp. platani TaxID=88771 RepID=A0A0F8DH44_CERFI|nr:ankyrin-like protein [Ceratocystis platani]